MVVFFGPTGGGKNTLSGMFGDWLRQERHSVCIINIDAGVEILSYEPWIDVRNHFTLVFLFNNRNVGG